MKIKELKEEIIFSEMIKRKINIISNGYKLETKTVEELQGEIIKLENINEKIEKTLKHIELNKDSILNGEYI